MESLYAGVDGVAVGQAVEDIVQETLGTQTIATIDTTDMWSDWHGTYHTRTLTVIEQTDKNSIYQPSFLVDDLFVKCDFLVRNDTDTYDLVEVKAKNTIRKKTNAAPLLDELIADVSVQRYVLEQVLGKQFSGKCCISHLNKEYVKQGTIDPQALILTEEVTDELRSNEAIEAVITEMRSTLPLDHKAFNARYPYDGTDYLSYFGEQPPAKSLWTISRLGSSKKAQLYAAGKVTLEEFWPTEIDFLKNNKGQDTAASRFLELWMQGEELIASEAVCEQLTSLSYPLYFYDYETMSTPVPVLDGTSPWQQVVVQYSLHKVQQDGTFTHHEGLLEPINQSDDGSLFAQTAPTNKSLIEQMLEDMDGGTQGTFVVRYKGFENSRNTELATQFPDLADGLLAINERTFDLMELFSNQLYFHRGFCGSSSIKKVLPVLTDITYDGMEIGNGAEAAQALVALITGQLDGPDARTTQKNLLAYCKQDSRAMVRIWEEVKKKVGMT